DWGVRLERNLWNQFLDRSQGALDWDHDGPALSRIDGCGVVSDAGVPGADPFVLRAHATAVGRARTAIDDQRCRTGIRRGGAMSVERANRGPTRLGAEVVLRAIRRR